MTQEPKPSEEAVQLADETVRRYNSAMRRSADENYSTAEAARMIDAAIKSRDEAAADLIDQLRAENERLKRQLTDTEQDRDLWKESEGTCERLYSELCAENERQAKRIAELEDGLTIPLRAIAKRASYYPNEDKRQLRINCDKIAVHAAKAIKILVAQQKEAG